jgi:SAM-dependent methyltransferase
VTETHAGAKQRLLALLRAALADGSFVKLTLSGYAGDEAGLRQMLLRPVVLRAGPRVSVVRRYATRDHTSNLEPAQAEALVASMAGTQFAHAHLFTTALSAQLHARAGQPARLRQGPPQHAQALSPAHDRRKARTLEPERAAWLATLGVTTRKGRVQQGMAGKLQQIEKFLEILAHRWPASWRGHAGAPVRVVDMGAGKGYLTFAVATWLQQQGIAAEVRGVEARADLVALCNDAAQQHGLSSLRFEVGAIADAPLPACDLLLALHACDTATDDAIARGIAAGAEVIVTSPCCHKELRPHLAPPDALAPLARHGILCERQAELVTDGLRAALLGAAGYHAEVFEFVATEHSSKNLMLFASKRAFVDQAAAARAARALASHFGVRQQRLATHLQFTLAPS